MWPGSAIADETERIIEEIPAPPLDYLVFEGGGVRGIAYAGVVYELDKADYLARIRHVAGSSIGAIAAMLVALGYHDLELEQSLVDLNFHDFLEAEKPFYYTPAFFITGKRWLKILTHHSLSSGKLMLDWLQKKIAKKLIYPDATFADLARKVESEQNDEKYPYKYLSVTGSNLTTDILEVFNHERTPNMPIALAVRISAAFPGVFRAVEWDNGQGVCLYVDGGVMNNLPYFIFRNEKYLKRLPPGYGWSKTGMNPAVLCIKVDMQSEIDGFWNKRREKAIKTLAGLSKAVLDSMQSRNREIIDEVALNVIQIHDHGIDTLQFTTNAAQKLKLMTQGSLDTKEWLHNHVSEAYKITVFKNQEAWLQAKSMEELADIKLRYQEILDGFLTLPSTNVFSDKIKQELEKKIDWFDHYIFYRSKKLTNSKPITLTFLPHINLPPIKPRQVMDAKIKNNLETRLQETEEHIASLERRIEEIKAPFHQQLNITAYDVTQDTLIYLVNLEEKVRGLLRFKRECQLKLHHSCEPRNEKKNLALFLTFRKELLAELNKNITDNTPAFMIMLRLLLQEYTLVYFSDDVSQMIIDIRNPDDLKLFVLALFLYLQVSQDAHELLYVVSEYYKSLFETIHLPTTMTMFNALLEKKGIDALTLAFRMEKLMNYFMCLDDPKEKHLHIHLLQVFKHLECLARGGKGEGVKQSIPAIIEMPNDIELNFCMHATRKPTSTLFVKSDEVLNLLCDESERGELVLK